MDSALRRPLVGVLTRGKNIKKLLKQEPHQSLVILAKANVAAGTTLYFFSYPDIDSRNKAVRGAYFDNLTGTWQEKGFPYPDCIYENFSGTRHREGRKVYEEMVKKENIPVLNYPYRLDKWEVYQHLIKEKNLLPHLPFSVAYRDPADLQRFLNIRGKAYLKGFAGGRGRKVLRAEARTGEGYEYRYYHDRLCVHRVKSFDSLIRGILGFFDGQPFLLQEAIDLIQVGSSIVDFRAEVQRGKHGSLTVAAIPVRVSQPGFPITTHAGAYPFESFLKTYLHYSDLQVLEFKNRVARFLTPIYTAIEKAYGPSVEMGIDYGLDKKGRLWFIECNSQSAKVSLYQAYGSDIIDRSALNILEYAKHRYPGSRPS